MPIPKPNPDEKEDAYVGRCMAAIGDENLTDGEVDSMPAAIQRSKKAGKNR